jgi:hypothetical protein
MDQRGNGQENKNQAEEQESTSNHHHSFVESETPGAP